MRKAKLIILVSANRILDCFWLLFVGLVCGQYFAGLWIESAAGYGLCGESFLVLFLVSGGKGG